MYVQLSSWHLSRSQAWEERSTKEETGSEEEGRGMETHVQMRYVVSFPYPASLCQSTDCLLCFLQQGLDFSNLTFDLCLPRGDLLEF